jgi:hypothetical protein
MTDMKFSQIIDYKEYPVEKMKQRTTAFYRDMKQRRSIRDFSDRPVPREIIEDCLCAAGTSPSGANMQPLNKILGRPANERPFLILVVGYPADNATVPEISKKSLKEISEFI